MEEIKRYWEKRSGFLSEFKVDARWILRDPNDDKAWGSLRIVSYPDLRPGYFKAIAMFVISRRPRTEEEMKQAIDEYAMDEMQLEVYSVDEAITTETLEHEASKKELEETFGIKIFGS